MPPYVVAMLTVQNNSPDSIRRALMWDALKYNLKLSKLSKTTLPGFYIHKGALHEVYYDTAGATAHAQEARLVSGAHRARSQPLSRGRDHHFSANDPVPAPLNPQSARLAINADAPLRLRKVSNTDAMPYVFTMDMTFGNHAANNTFTWQRIPGTSTPLKLRVLIDTGGNGLLWTYSTESSTYSISPDGAAVALTNEQRAMLTSKNKIQYSKQGSTFRVEYSNGTIPIDYHYTTIPMIAIWDANNCSFEIPNYKIGAVVGVSPIILAQPFDGICGLGRSHSTPHSQRGITIVQHMFKTNVIQEEQFYVCCRYMPDIAFGHGFVIFGGWPSSFDLAPNWTTVHVPADAANGKWDIDLAYIHILAPGMETKKFGMDCRVRVDNGTMRSIFVNSVVSRMKSALDEIWEATGLPGFDVPETVEVELGFKNTTQGAFMRSRSEIVAVRGRAKNFFVIPNEFSSTAPRIFALSGVQEASTKYMLGINFFRTFLVGFRDTARQPAVQIAPQP
ncbi:hypothetical protein AURDEDRAFT_155055 [Auricularia subglabra TFB-10046 SS5]|nr:hypothetical protein AURDEDRAFT_155055 [Auricularia subglabra TFB-10046 SS5]